MRLLFWATALSTCDATWYGANYWNDRYGDYGIDYDTSKSSRGSSQTSLRHRFLLVGNLIIVYTVVGYNTGMRVLLTHFMRMGSDLQHGSPKLHYVT